MGLAMTLDRTVTESGVGRLHTIWLITLSFYEYIHFKPVKLPALPELRSLRVLYTLETASVVPGQGSCAPVCLQLS